MEGTGVMSAIGWAGGLLGMAMGVNVGQCHDSIEQVGKLDAPFYSMI
jgi:hypothetical protein